MCKWVGSERVRNAYLRWRGNRGRAFYSHSTETFVTHVVDHNENDVMLFLGRTEAGHE